MRCTSSEKMGIVLAALAVCLFIHGAPARGDFVFGEPTKVPNVNSSSYDCEVHISPDGLELYFVSDRSPHVDECDSDIWVSRRLTTRDPWSSPVRFDSPVNSAGPEGAPCLSADGLELYFSDGWAALYNGCVPRPGGYGGSDLWVSKRASREDTWDAPENLGPAINTESLEDTPSISTDGLSLYFGSDRPGGYGYVDLYVTTRQTKNDPWGPPMNLGSAVNAQYPDSCPNISPEGLSLFFTRGTYSTDILVSRRATATDPWGLAETFTPVFSPQAEYFLSFSAHDSTIYFTRGDATFARPTYDLWQVEVIPLVDFNTDGAVDALDVCDLAEHWGPTEDSLYDIAPFPFGDGVVDAQDLLVLAKHMIEHDEDVSDVNDL